MSYTWNAEVAARRSREGAVSDVLDGMTDVGAAALWKVQVEDLRQWVDEARADRRGDHSDIKPTPLPRAVPVEH